LKFASRLELHSKVVRCDRDKMRVQGSGVALSGLMSCASMIVVESGEACHATIA
jgi:hypothetical protein